MNPLDERFALNSITDLNFTDPIISDGTTNHFLEPLQSIVVQPSTLPTVKVPLGVNTTEGFYRMILLTTETPSNQCPSLQPNNLSYGAVFKDTAIRLGYNTTTSTYSVVGTGLAFTLGSSLNGGYAIWADIQAGVTDVGPAITYWLFSTYTSNKQVFIHAGSNYGLAIHSVVWNDTTTKWFSLGTIFPWISGNEFTYFKAYIQRLK